MPKRKLDEVDDGEDDKGHKVDPSDIQHKKLPREDASCAETRTDNANTSVNEAPQQKCESQKDRCQPERTSCEMVSADSDSARDNVDCASQDTVLDEEPSSSQLSEADQSSQCSGTHVVSQSQESGLGTSQLDDTCPESSQTQESCLGSSEPQDICTQSTQESFIESSQESIPESSQLNTEDEEGSSKVLSEGSDIPKIDEELQPSPRPSKSVESEDDLSPPRKKRKRVHFDGVTVYYFTRKQGFTCVPSQGGSTLGMDEEHSAVEEYGVGEFQRIKKSLHREILLEQHQQGKIYLPPHKVSALRSALSDQESVVSSSVGSSDEEEEEEDLTVEEYYFLQPITTRQRRLMLRQAGIKKIDATEKEDCKDIRGSREVCGCDCKVYCDPDTCICAKAGIKCQVDRPSFPCGCTKDGCANPKGRIEFNPIRVRTHFIHTLMRLETEKKCEEIKSKRKKGLAKHIRFADENDGIAKIEETEGTAEEVGSDDEDVEEEEDASFYNSNERGSCCDCQNSEVNDFLMRESQYGGTGVEMEPCNAAPYSAGIVSEEAQMTAALQGGNVGEIPQVMLYNDEDEYNAENTTNMYQFTKEESSYSESSDCSSEGSNPDQEHVSAANYGAYQQVAATYDVSTSSSAGHDGPHSVTAPSYNIPSNGGFTANKMVAATAASTTQPEQKYMDLNSTSAAYKLEPISQILNPIRVGVSYNEAPPSWGQTSTDSFCQFSGNNTSADGNYQPSTAAAATTSSYMYTNSSSDSGYMSYNTSLTAPQSAVSSTQYHQLTPSSSAPSAPAASCSSTSGSMSSPTQPQQQEADLQPKSSPCQILDLDQQTTTTTSSSCSQLLDLDQQHKKVPAPSTDMTKQKGTLMDLNQHACNQQQQAGICKAATTVVPSSSSSSAPMPAPSKEVGSVESTAAEGGKDSSATSTDSEDSGLGSLSDDQAPTQDFGEIIKESIVETVSA